MKKLLTLFVAIAMTMTVFAGRAFDGTEKLYFNAAGGPSWWAGVAQTAYLKPMEGADVSVSGVIVSDNIYEFTIPAGTYQSMYIQRGTWNTTGNIPLDGTEATNYISVFAENSATVTWTVYEAPAPLPTRNFSGTEKLYFNAAGGPNWWAGVDQTAYLRPAAGADISVAGVVVAGNIYEFTIPAGDYQSLYIQRGTWNKTGNIPLAGTEVNNYISAFAENSADVTWDNYNPAADPEPIVYSIKTNWKEGGWGAGFKELTVNDDGTQSMTETYTGNGFNISPSFLGTDWYPVDKLNLVGGVAANDLVTISVNPNATSQEEVFTITKISSPEPEPEPEPEDTPEHLYILGNIDGIGWEPAASAEMTKDGDIFTGTYTFTEATSYFAFTIVQGSWDDVNANRYYSAALTVGAAPIALTKANESSTIVQGTYIITVNWANMTVSATAVPTLETNLYLAGTFNSWSTTSHNFIRQNIGDEVAYTTIAGVSTSGDIEFKVVEGGQWCNAVTQNITSESTSITFLENDGSGYQVKMTPYAAGDYVVAFNLTTRVLTVTYPAGDMMEETHAIALAGTFNSWGEEHPAFEKQSLTSYTVTQHLATGSYEFRVIVDGAWKGADYNIQRDYCSNVELIADQNFALTADIEGDYVFDYNPQTQMLNVTYPAMVTCTAYFLNSPGYKNVYAYVYNGGGGLGSWPGELATPTGEQKYGYDVYSYTFPESYTGVIFHGNTGTQVEVAFDPEKPYVTEAGVVANLEAVSTEEVTISAYQYSTLFSNKALRIPAGVTAEYVVGMADGSLVMEQFTDIIPANSGALISGAASTKFTFVEAREVDAPAINWLKGSTSNATINNSLVHYILSRNEEGVFGLYWPYGTTEGVGSFNNQAGKAYLELPAGGPSAAPRGFALRATDTATSVESIDNTTEQTKIFINGQLYILSNGRMYNVLGIRIK